MSLQSILASLSLEDWLKIMHKSAETLKVVDCCQNELLRQMLPVLLAGLETCQKSLGLDDWTTPSQ